MAQFQSNMATRTTPFSTTPTVAAPTAPAGTFLPGTKVQVGSHRVVIDRYLSEGGFAHVYVVSLPQLIDGQSKAVLKRVAVPDKDHLTAMRTEVETMKRLRGHKYIVKYIDSHASPLKNGGYEVFLLMEWCNGGGLIDFMNTRLQNRLTEPEIINIFTDVAEGVAHMHHQKPPLMHRDLKIENVLITTDGKNRTFKVCDFGSAALARPAARTAAEGRATEIDVQKHTTLQYRSPEMVDVYRKQPIDEKSDIWALGCFLYKLCYYVTPFEEAGQMAILNARFKYPGHPKFSDELKLLIASMLREDPAKRPDISQVLAQACRMDGRALTTRDNEAGKTTEKMTKITPIPSGSNNSAGAGVSIAPPKPATQYLVPEVEPMRRGRPERPTSTHTSAKPSPSPLRMMDDADGFSQLISNKPGQDELSSKFPSLNEFSLMSDKTDRHTFKIPQKAPENGTEQNISKKVVESLADEAFVAAADSANNVSKIPNRSTPIDNTQKQTSGETRGTSAFQKTVFNNAQRPQTVSVGTMTSPKPSPRPSQEFKRSEKPIWRVPEKATTPAISVIPYQASRSRPSVGREQSASRLATLVADDSVRSQGVPNNYSELTGPSMPSLERDRLLLRNLDSGISRSRSLNYRNRPASVAVSSSRPIRINDTETQPPTNDQRTPVPKDDPPRFSRQPSSQNIENNVDFLRAREEEEREKNMNVRRSVSANRHQKRQSLPSITLAGTKNMLQGRFGDTFKMFESNKLDKIGDHEDESAITDTVPAGPLSPIAGSVTTDRSEDHGQPLDETEELSPALRRELEKQQLEAEELRVERAAAEYKQRRAGAPPISAKAASIQNRVQSLLADHERPVVKTAVGYGKFTRQAGDGTAAQTYQTDPIARTASAPAAAERQSLIRPTDRPMAPPKPKTLQRPTTMMNSTSIVREQEAVPDLLDDDEFSKKYPSLTHLEVVETEIGRPGLSNRTMKEV